MNSTSILSIRTRFLTKLKRMRYKEEIEECTRLSVSYICETRKKSEHAMHIATRSAEFDNSDQTSNHYLGA